MRALLTAFLGALAACEESLGPDDIPAAVTYEPPPAYRQLWVEVEECSGRRGAFDRVRWYIVPDRATFRHHGKEIAGYWWPSHEIVVAGFFATDERTVRHEMLHDLLGTDGHPREYFIERCGALVHPR